MKVIIDRFEGQFAVVELPDKTLINMPSVLLPDASEGDVVSINIEHEETRQRAERIHKMFEKLKNTH